MTTPAANPSSLSSRLLRGGVWVVGGRVAGIALGLGVNMVLTRSLSDAQYGQFSLAYATILIAAAAGRFGVGRLVVREIPTLSEAGNDAGIPAFLRQCLVVMAWATAAAVVIAGVVTACFPAIRAAAHPAAIVAAVAVGVAAVAFLQVAAETFRGLHDLRLATLFDGQRGGPLVGLLLLAGIAIASLATTLSATIAVTLLAGAQLGVLALAYYALRKRLAASPGNPAPGTASRPPIAMRALLGSASGIAMVEILAMLLGLGDVWIAGATLEPVGLSRWSATAQLMMVVGVPLTMINMTVISSISPLHSQGQLSELQRLLQAAATVATVLCIIPLGLLALAPGLTLSMLFGESFAAAGPALALISLSKLIAVWTGPCAVCLVLTGHERAVLVNNILSALLLAGAGWYAATNHGLMGLAWTVAGVTVFSNLFNWLAARRYVGVWTHGSPGCVRRAFSHSRLAWR